MQVNAVFQLSDTGFKRLKSATGETQAPTAVPRRLAGVLADAVHLPWLPDGTQITFAAQKQGIRKRGIRAGRFVLARCVVCIIILGLAAVTANAGTIHVDDDAPNDPVHGDPTISDPDEDGTPEHPFDAIQKGIDAATNGDTVLVATGVYTGEGNKDLDVGSMSIALRSANGSDDCIIDCEGSGRGFYFRSGTTSVLDGFTITNCTAYYGGGILCEASEPTIRNCVITNNTATYGGGICVRNFSSPTISNCRMTANEAGQAGGGVYCANECFMTISECDIYENVAMDWSTYGHAEGGGVACENNTLAKPQILNCRIRANRVLGGSAARGGGVALRNTDATIADSSITENEAQAGHNAFGGGIDVRASNPHIVNCTIAGNTAHAPNDYYSPRSGDGGGISGLGGNPTIINCRITLNWAMTNGGGISFYGDPYNESVPRITSCTFADNHVESESGTGGAVYIADNCDARIVNSILWGNSAPQGVEIACADGPNLAVSFNDVRGGTDWLYVEEDCTLDWGLGNIDVNPRFAGAQNGNYRLLPESPCIDAGDNTAVLEDIIDLDGDGDTAERTPLDLDRTARFVDDCQTPDTGNPDPPEYLDIVDMGAYEHDRVDADEDGIVDLIDFADYQVCYTGDIPGLVDGCERFDSDCDDDVDLVDFSALLSATTGPR